MISKTKPELGVSSGWLFILFCVNAYLFFVTAQSFKFNCTVYKSKQCIIAATAYIFTGVNMSASLTNEDVAGFYNLAICSFCAKSF